MKDALLKYAMLGIGRAFGLLMNHCGPFRRMMVAKMNRVVAQCDPADIPTEARELWKLAEGTEDGRRVIADQGLAHTARKIIGD